MKPSTLCFLRGALIEMSVLFSSHILGCSIGYKRDRQIKLQTVLLTRTVLVVCFCMSVDSCQTLVKSILRSDLRKEKNDLVVWFYFN